MDWSPRVYVGFFFRLRYNLGEQTWIEYWPTQEEAQTEKYKDKYIGIAALADQLFNFGCTT